MGKFPVDKRNKVRRIPNRGFYDKKTINDILDNAFVCHVGFVMDGQPFVIPMAYGRKNDRIFLHGSIASRLLNQTGSGVPVCVTVTHLDGIVLARSAFHSSMNYRSAVLFGQAKPVATKKKEAALKAITEHILKGRWAEARPVKDKELRGTSVLEMKISQASAKIRTGPPLDDKEDYVLPIWAGVLPIKHIYGDPETDPKMNRDIGLPKSVANLQLSAPGRQVNN